MSMIYVASPYSHPDPGVRQRRYDLAKCWIAIATKESLGLFFYSPIVYWHPIALEFDLPTDYKLWLNLDQIAILRSSEVNILLLDGYDVSEGIEAEMEFARSVHKPIVEMDPTMFGVPLR